MQQVPVRGRARRKIRIGKAQTGGTGNAVQPTGHADDFVDFYSQAVIDIDDKIANRYLNQKYGNFWTVPHFEFRLQQFGTAVVGTANSGLVLRAPKDLVVHDVTAMTGATPGSTSINFDVKLVASPTAAGTSIFTGGSAPSIGTAVGSDFSYVSGTAAISNYYWAAGTFLRVEVSQVGSGSGNVTGKDLSVRIGATLPLLSSSQSWELGGGASSANPYVAL